MTVVRVLGAVGKTVIALGVIILLFGIFQLWGTGIIEARAQQGLDNEFAELLEASGTLGPSPIESRAANTPNPAPPTPTAEPTTRPSTEAPQAGTSTAQAASSPASPATPDPTTTPESAEYPPPPDQPDPEWLAMLYRDWGSAIARIEIPRLEVDKTVVEGVRVGDLRKGPGHYPDTPLPGQAGNVAIAGHRTTYGAPFGDIDKLSPGDEIVITTIQGQFTYLVVEQGDGHGHLIVAPTAVEVLDQDFTVHPNRLTLTACHPKGSARQRIIVVGELIGDPVPTFARPGQSPLTTSELATENVDETIDAEQTVTPSPAPETSEAAPPTSNQTESLTPVPAATEAASTPTAPPAIAEELPEPTPAPEREQTTNSFGEGLDGDSDAWAPAILWGIAALAIWFFALFAGRRWKRLPSYALSALPFLVVLFMAFWHIDRIMPSY